MHIPVAMRAHTKDLIHQEPYTTSCGRDLDSPAISSSHRHAQSLSSSGRFSAYIPAISRYTTPSRSGDCALLCRAHLYQALRMLCYFTRGPLLAEGEMWFLQRRRQDLHLTSPTFVAHRSSATVRGLRILSARFLIALVRAGSTNQR